MNLKALSAEFGVDIQACMECVYDLALNTARLEQTERFIRLSKLTPDKLAAECRDIAGQASRDNERAIQIIRRMWKLMRDEHRFVTNGWLQHNLENAISLGDYKHAEQLRELLAFYEQGGPRERKPYTKQKRRTRKGKK